MAARNRFRLPPKRGYPHEGSNLMPSLLGGVVNNGYIRKAPSGRGLRVAVGEPARQ